MVLVFHSLYLLSYWSVRNLMRLPHFHDLCLCPYFEWPTSSHGWDIGPLRRLRTAAAALGHPLHEVRFHGCAFGMRSKADRSNFVPKVWRVLTNDSTLHEVARICCRNHSHVRIHNVETRATAFYPKSMARAIAKHMSY